MNWTDEDRAELTDLGATEYGALVRDAKRYRWLRGQTWDKASLCAVSAPKASLKLGAYCPSQELLDAAIDAAMEAANE